MPLVVIEAGIAAACGIALFSAALPAHRAARLRVVDALAGRSTPMKQYWALLCIGALGAMQSSIPREVSTLIDDQRCASFPTTAS